MPNDVADREALRRELPYRESFTEIELLNGFGRWGIDPEKTAADAADECGRSLNHQIAALCVLSAWCAFYRNGIEHDIANGDVALVTMPDGSVFDEVRFSGHSAIASLMRQVLRLCDRFGLVPLALPCGTADLSDSAKTLSCMAVIEQWTSDKIEALINRKRSRPLAPNQIERIYGREWRTIKGWIDDGTIWAKALDSKNYQIALADLPDDWESRLRA